MRLSVTNSSHFICLLWHPLSPFSLSFFIINLIQFLVVNSSNISFLVLIFSMSFWGSSHTYECPFTAVCHFALLLNFPSLYNFAISPVRVLELAFQCISSTPGAVPIPLLNSMAELFISPNLKMHISEAKGKPGFSSPQGLSARAGLWSRISQPKIHPGWLKETQSQRPWQCQEHNADSWTGEAVPASVPVVWLDCVLVYLTPLGSHSGVDPPAFSLVL